MGALAGMERLQLQRGRWFPEHIAAEFRQCYMVYRRCLNDLADHAISAGLMRWHMRPKAHMLGHMAFQFVPRNPRYFHVYLDEDFVARTKRVAEASHPVFVSRLAMFRYILHVCKLWSQ